MINFPLAMVSALLVNPFFYFARRIKTLRDAARTFGALLGVLGVALLFLPSRDLTKNGWTFLGEAFLDYHCAGSVLFPYLVIFVLPAFVILEEILF